MKQVFFITSLILTFCYGAFAQTENDKTDAIKQEPKLLAELSDRESEWDKTSVYLITDNLRKNPSQFGLIRIRNDKYLLNRLAHLRKAIAFSKVDSSHIVFLIVDEQRAEINVLIAENCPQILMCEYCILIRAADLDKIKKLFGQNNKRNRKK